MERVDDLWQAAFGLVHMLGHVLGVSHDDHSGTFITRHLLVIILDQSATSGPCVIEL